MNLTLRVAAVVVLVGLGMLAVQARRSLPAAQERPLPMMRDVTIHASGCAFIPSDIEAWRGDRLRITLVADDGIYSFALDEYRILKQFAPGRNAVVEFLADRPGQFAFYNSQTRDGRCAAMHGELVIH
jgi:heme/copper-type cytochrome/quinol oxidase subunit 2